MKRVFFQHVVGGDVFAIELDRYANVIGSCGPLHYTEVDTSLLPDFDYTKDDNHWFIKTATQWRVLSPERIAEYRADIENREEDEGDRG